MKKILLLTLVLLTLCYPFIIYAGLSFLSVRYMALVLIGVFALRFLLTRPHRLTLSNCIPLCLCLVGITIGIIGAIFANALAIKLYPVIVNALMLAIFLYSLYHPPTIIERFARLKNKDLPDAAISYTRWVTISWCIFFVINGSIALWTVFFASFKIWTLYNGLLSYLFIGAFFVGELLIRYWVKRRNKFDSICDFKFLLKRLEENPQAIIFQCKNKAINAHQFLNDIDALAAKILATPHQRWALCYRDSYRFSVGLFAVLSCNKNTILLPNTLPSTVKRFASEYDALLSDIGEIDSTVSVKSLSGKYSNRILDTNVNITFFTSGTTGLPKKISRTLQKIAMEISTLDQAFASRMNGSVFFSTVSHQHLYGLTFNIFWPLLTGHQIVREPVEFPEQLESIFKREKTITLITSPAFLQRIDQQQFKPSKLNIFSAGGHLSQHVISTSVNHLGSYPIDIFGSTESGVIAYRLTEKQRYWRAFPTIKLTQDAEDCLVITSPFASKTKQLTTNDQIIFHQENRFELLDRVDRTVKIEGKRVSLIEIEQHLQQHDFIDDVCSIKIEDKRQYIGVIIKLSELGFKALSEHSKQYINKQLKAFLSADFDRLLLPRRFRYVDHIPSNPQGKRITSELRELFK